MSEVILNALVFSQVSVAVSEVTESENRKPLVELKQKKNVGTKVASNPQESSNTPNSQASLFSVDKISKSKAKVAHDENSYSGNASIQNTASNPSFPAQTCKEFPLHDKIVRRVPGPNKLSANPSLKLMQQFMGTGKGKLKLSIPKLKK